mmetsp:Transcript_23602/g.54417  ORF Transcript_23602/g.54417 Transcript_23602/m.54417 type:complete len:395 (-) Transcript_23602:2268-3452(-)
MASVSSDSESSPSMSAYAKSPTGRRNRRLTTANATPSTRSALAVTPTEVADMGLVGVADLAAWAAESCDIIKLHSRVSVSSSVDAMVAMAGTSVSAPALLPTVTSGAALSGESVTATSGAVTSLAPASAPASSFSGSSMIEPCSCSEPSWSAGTLAPVSDTEAALAGSEAASAGCTELDPEEPDGVAAHADLSMVRRFLSEAAMRAWSSFARHSSGSLIESQTPKSHDFSKARRSISSMSVTMPSRAARHSLSVMPLHSSHVGSAAGASTGAGSVAWPTPPLWPPPFAVFSSSSSEPPTSGCSSCASSCASLSSSFSSAESFFGTPAWSGSGSASGSNSIGACGVPAAVSASLPAVAAQASLSMARRSLSEALVRALSRASRQTRSSSEAQVTR